VAASNAYTVNPLFYNMHTTATTFEYVAQTNAFLNDMQAYTVLTQREGDVMAKATTSNVVFTESPQATPPFTFLDGINTVPPVCSSAPVPTDQYSVYVKPTYKTVVSASKISSALQVISSGNYSFSLNNVNVSRARYNENFSQYLNMIVTSICKPFYMSSRASLPTIDAATSPQMAQAVEELSTMNTTRINTLHDLIVEQTFRSLVLLAQEEPQANDNANFADLRTGSFTSAFYYKLRTHIVRNLNIPQKTFYASDADVADYFKKLVVDHYLKTMYPVVQYAYLGAMNERYKAQGDYINMRWCTFTMITYVLGWVLAIKRKVDRAATENPSDISNFTVLRDQTVSAQISTILDNINQYLNAINTNFIPGATFSNTANEVSSTKSMIRSLRLLSNQVQDQSNDVSQLQEEMYKSQVALRNLNESTKVINKQYANKLLEYYIVLSVVFLVIVLAATLIYLNKAEFAMIGAAGLITVVLMYKVTLMIISYFFSS